MIDPVLVTRSTTATARYVGTVAGGFALKPVPAHQVVPDTLPAKPLNADVAVPPVSWFALDHDGLHHVTVAPATALRSPTVKTPLSRPPNTVVADDVFCLETPIEVGLRRFVEWSSRLTRDEDLGRDPRMMVPLFYDVGREKTKVWVVLGWSGRPLEVGFREPPKARVLRISDRQLEAQRDAVAEAKAAHARAEANDRTGRFMSEDARWRDGAVLDLLDVRRADTADGDPDKEFARPDARHGHCFEPQIIRAAVHRGLHGAGNYKHGGY